MKKLQVRSFAIPEKYRHRFTPGKRYDYNPWSWDGKSATNVGRIVDDEGTHATIVIENSAFLNGKSWDIITVMPLGLGWLDKLRRFMF